MEYLDVNIEHCREFLIEGGWEEKRGRGRRERKGGREWGWRRESVGIILETRLNPMGHFKVVTNPPSFSVVFAKEKRQS